MKNKISLILLFIGYIYTQDIDPVYTGSFGSVTINNQVYNQFSLRPELIFGKIGLGLDLYFYFDQDGNLYDENWNFSSSKDVYKTLVDKIYYLRYGVPSDDLYFRIGALPSITLGHGSLVNGYSNVMDYPRVRRTGVNFKYNFPNFKFHIVHSNLKEAKEPGLFAIGGSFEYVKNVDFSFNIIVDPNQRKGLLDSDRDGYPDFVEPNYANDSSQWHLNQDIISWINDNCPVDDDCSDQIALAQDEMDQAAYLLDLNDKNQVAGISLGLTYNLNNRMKLFSEFSQLSGETLNPYDFLTQQDDYNSFDNRLGFGYIPIGFIAEWDKVTLTLDLRQNSENYLFNYWDQNYDHTRAMVIEENDANVVRTKEDKLYLYGKSKGASLNIVSNFLKIFQLEMMYQYLNGDKWDESISNYKSNQNSTFYTKLDIDTSIIQKVRIAEIFYQQSYSDKPFSFKPDQNTLFGYNIGVEMADNMILILKGRKSYVFDNDGFRPVKTTQIETQVIF